MVTQTKKQRREAREARELAHRIARAQAEAQRLSNELHDGRIAPNAAEYNAYREDAPTKGFVYHHWGSWTAFCESCGLTARDARYYYAKAAERQAEWKRIDSEPRIRCADARTDGAGLTVKPTPRVETWRSEGRMWSGLAWEVR